MEAQHPTPGTIRTLACPIRSPQSEPRVGIAPKLGEHTGELMAELGYRLGEITAFVESGVL
jgi:crotonobetainyl-CoA:carnitine CoA-transferase CaiB-like acyl-CoA transferase